MDRAQLLLADETELNPLSYYLLKPQLIKAMNVFCLTYKKGSSNLQW